MLFIFALVLLQHDDVEIMDCRLLYFETSVLCVRFTRHINSAKH